jgi:hypothetical protein
MGKLKINKSKILLSLPLVLISIKAYFGAVFGYFFARVLAQRVDSIIFSIGKLQVHFHHWIIGLICLIAAFLFSLSPLIGPLLYGFFGGLIFEGISSYPDWHKILTKKKR